MTEPEDNRKIEILPTLLHQSLRNGAMLEVLIMAVGELLAHQRGIPKEEMLVKMREAESKIVKELTDLAAK